MDWETLLVEGIEILRQKDACIDSLISPHSEEIISLLVRYIKEIELFNPAYGLVKVNDTKELVIRHILDSLSPLGIISRLLAETDAQKIADAGSGAGLPGIPLAIAMPNCGFTLIERMGRRAGFLWNTKAALGLSNIAVEENELEKTAPGRFALVTFRAFKPLEPKLLKALFNACVCAGAGAGAGIIAAYKGRREKTEQEMSPLEKPFGLSSGHLSNELSSGVSASGGWWETIPYSVPFLDEERHLLVIKQTALTKPE
jgi:16S rRNA (guanine527-N7)-methyltransferase